MSTHDMSTPAREIMWFANETMADRPNLPRVMALESVALRELMDRDLSDQQKRVILLLAEGYANKHIAWVLGIEEATAKAHVSAILKKFSCTNRTQAALLGLRVRLHANNSSSMPIGPAKSGATVANEGARHCIS